MKSISEVENKIICGDCLKVMKNIPDNSVDLIATDPPYGISFMCKDWDKFNEIVDSQGAYAKKKGFKKLPRQKTESMIEFFVPVWKDCLRILKPGGFAFIMCSPRQDVLSKQTQALSQAGFQMGFSSIYWTYASGFPKAQNISKSIDKRKCKEQLTEKLGRKPTKKESDDAWKEFREVVGKKDGTYADIRRDTETGQDGLHGGIAKERDRIMVNITKSATSQAKVLDGSYAGFQPKPAVEIILVCMKSLSEKSYVGQALKNRKGITHLDDVRIPYKSDDDIITKNPHTSRKNSREHTEIYGEYKPSNYELPKGRFPANLLVSNDVLNNGKITKSSGGKSGHTEAYQGGYKEEYYKGRKPGLGDSGSFSRYFDLDKWFTERIKQLPESVQRTFPFFIVPKASKSEKNRGLENMPKGEPPGSGRSKPALGKPRQNIHPTVKPIKLFSYLIILGSRPGDIVLDPFIGSGSSAIACKPLNRKYIGIDMSKEYCEIAEKRIASVDPLFHQGE